MAARKLEMPAREPVPLARIIRPYAGLWVAVKHGKVVEAAENPALLAGRLSTRDITDATIVRAPRPDEGELVGLG